MQSVNLQARIGRVSDRQLATIAGEAMLVLLAIFILGRFEAVVAGPRHGEPNVPIAAEALQESRLAVPSAPVIRASNACSFGPLLKARDAADGKYRLETALAAARLPSFNSLMTVGASAEGQQRLHDAEVAFIAACRVAERAQGSQSVDVASAQAKLAQVYLGSLQGGAAGSESAVDRAHDLMVESLATYTAILGPQSSRTTVAAQKLARFEAAQSQGFDAAMLLEEQEAASAASTVMGSAPVSIDAICSANPTVPPCNDPELSQAEADLVRLQSQAAAVTRDPQGFDSRLRVAQASRAECADVACLKRWYGHRRGELLREF